MATKQSNYDADYDRWGHTPGAIRVTKPKKTSAKRSGSKGSKKK